MMLNNVSSGCCAETDTTDSEVQAGSGGGGVTGHGYDGGRYYPGRLIEVASFPSVCVSVITGPVQSNDTLLVHGHSYLPPPLFYAKNRASRLNGEVSYTYTDSELSEFGFRHYTVRKKIYGPAKGGPSPNAPPPKYATESGRHALYL